MTQKDPSDEELMLRIRETMLAEKPFLNSNLKVADLAALMGTNSRYISRCINICENRSFSDFVNDYRIEHAKQLMIQHPKIKVGSAGTASGFSNEQTFFRIFKQATGQTPGDWRSKL